MWDAPEAPGQGRRRRVPRPATRLPTPRDWPVRTGRRLPLSPARAPTAAGRPALVASPPAAPPPRLVVPGLRLVAVVALGVVTRPDVVRGRAVDAPLRAGRPPLTPGPAPSGLVQAGVPMQAVTAFARLYKSLLVDAW